MRPFNICLVSSEVAPFAKTGGLADVSAALTRFLVRDGHDARLVMPMYRRIAEGGWELEPVPELQDISVEFGDRRYSFSMSTATLPKSEAKVWFVRCPELYDREGIYTQDDDEHLRFAFLCHAAIRMCQHLQWRPDVFHCNDWHTGLLPLYLWTVYAWDGLFRNTRTVMTIHNIAYQGVFSSYKVFELGLGNERKYLYQEDLDRNEINLLKTGLLYANAITTVSRTYAREIQTEELGMGLDPLLRERQDVLVGIVNGVDYGEWSPEQDSMIPFRYSEKRLSGKARNKQALLERMGLPHDPDVPVIGIISRLTAQKGFELLPDILPVLLHKEDLRLTILGSGEEKHEAYFDWLMQTFPGKVAYDRGYKEDLSHQIEAGADMFLMPSRFEPCGLNQMYSLKYGTPPIVRRTGGLADTVEPWDPGAQTGTGFVFGDFTPEALFDTLRFALECYRDREAWRKLMLNGMAKDYSWDHQGRLYVELYERIVPGPDSGR